MVDDAATASPVCPWCSAALPAEAGTTCPSCGATLRSDSEPQLPGVTAIDAEAIVRAARAPTPQRRNRILSWISGDYDEEPAAVASAPGSLAPPPPEVRREMLRLELEAEVANLQAEAESIMADAEVDGRQEPAEAALEAPAERPDDPANPDVRDAAADGVEDASAEVADPNASTVDHGPEGR